MSKIFIIDAGQMYAQAQGKLNHTLTSTAATFLRERGHQVDITVVHEGYRVADEIQKFLAADTLIYQMPGWWMGEPWFMKKYIDEVFTAGYGSLYASDGRTHSDDSKQYGSGGLLQGKNYMLSVTWNAPLEAFTDPEQFFEGAGVDGVYLHCHKANQFLGLKPLPTFICNDVVKKTNVPHYIKSYRQHLVQVFGQ